jgi:DNA replication protein DnaC
MMRAQRTTMMTTDDLDELRQRLRALGLYALARADDDILAQPWVRELLNIEEPERRRRSLERRLANARIGPFKPIADFDWRWPESIDRALIEELFTLSFADDATNVVFLGPNGVGKSMLAKNLAHHAVMQGHVARFVSASDMLHDLAAQDSDASLARRLRRYTAPWLLCIDELGYLAYDNRYADLLFEVITRRYLNRPSVITTNKPFAQWGEVFPNAACVVTLIDRLMHRAELVNIDAESYRAKEAEERAKARRRVRKKAPHKTKATTDEPTEDEA